MTTTSTTTTTTIPVFGLSASPSYITSCSEVLISADMTPENPLYTLLDRMMWYCTPAEHPFCVKIADAVAATGAKTNEVYLSPAVVGAAANDIPGSGQPVVGEVDLLVEALTVSGRIFFRGRTSFIFDASGDLKLMPVPGVRSWTLLDRYVRLSAERQTCNPTVNQNARIVWAWRNTASASSDYTAISGQTKYDMRMEISTLPGAGTYSFELTHSDATSPALFEVEILPIPPPVIVLSAPTKTTPTCITLLDASGSTDPGGAALSFAWSCTVPDNTSAVAASAAECKSIASQAAGGVLTIPGGSLAQGKYTFTVNVSRSDAFSTRTVVVELATSAGSQPPAVSMGRLPAEVSPQLPAVLPATITEDSVGGCLAPRYKAWWIFPVTATGSPIEANATLLKRVDTTTVVAGLDTFSVQAKDGVVLRPVFATPGRYLVRLALSDQSTASYSFVPGSTFIFDSAAFLVDTPPTTGKCRIFPEAGEIALTKFRVDSLNWVDDDLPLQHRFAWQAGAMTAVTATGWTILSKWSQATYFENLIIGKVGTVSVRAEAQDTLGSISAAMAEGTVATPQVAPSEGDLLAIMADMKSSGATGFTAVAAVTAVASASAGGGATSNAFASSLMDSVATSGILDDPTPEAISSSTSALDSILVSSIGGAASTDTAQTKAVDISVADKAASFVTDIAAAAGDMEGGLDEGLASNLMGSVGTLFSATGDAPTTPTTTVPPSAGGLTTLAPQLSADEIAAQQKAKREQQQKLSSKLRSATSSIGDALLKAQPVGQEVTVSSKSATGGRGLSMSAKKQTPETVRTKNNNVGGFEVPPLGNLVRRRLQTANCTDTSVGMQYIVWPSNPFAFAGNGSNGTLAGDSSGEWDSECCEISSDAVVSMNMRLCGAELQVHDLDENITFEVYAPRLFNDSEGVVEERICQYFDEQASAWTSEGCWTVELFDDRVSCACNHLSSFSAAFGKLTKVLEQAVVGAFVCSNAQVLAPESLRNLGKGDWARERAAVLMWVLMIVLIIVAVVAHHRAHRMRIECGGLSREEVLMRLAADTAHHKGKASKLAEAKQRMQDARRLHRRSKFLGFVMFKLHTKLVGYDAGLEDMLMKSPLKGLTTCIMVWGMRLSCITNTGIHRRDLPALGPVMQAYSAEHRKLSKSTAPSTPNSQDQRKFMQRRLTRIAGLGEKYGGGLSSARRDLVAGGYCCGANRFFMFFLAFHPLVNATQFSMLMWTNLNVLAFYASIFGALAVSALFLEGTSVQRNSPPMCGGETWEVTLVRDIFIAIFSSVIVWLPVGLVLKLHRRQMDPVAEDNEKVRKEKLRAKVRRRLLVDCALSLVFAAWIVLCILLVLSFLANVRPGDADHWVVAALSLVLRSWLLIPLLIAACWRLLMMFMGCMGMTGKAAEALEMIEKSEAHHEEGNRAAPLMDRPPVGAWDSLPDDFLGAPPISKELKLPGEDEAPVAAEGLAAARATEEAPKPPVPPPPPPRRKAGDGADPANVVAAALGTTATVSDPHFWDWATTWAKEVDVAAKPEAEEEKRPPPPPPPPPRRPLPKKAAAKPVVTVTPPDQTADAAKSRGSAARASSAGGGASRLPDVLPPPPRSKRGRSGRSAGASTRIRSPVSPPPRRKVQQAQAAATRMDDLTAAGPPLGAPEADEQQAQQTPSRPPPPPPPPRRISELQRMAQLQEAAASDAEGGRQLPPPPRGARSSEGGAVRKRPSGDVLPPPPRRSLPLPVHPGAASAGESSPGAASPSVAAPPAPRPPLPAAASGGSHSPARRSAQPAPSAAGRAAPSPPPLPAAPASPKPTTSIAQTPAAQPPAAQAGASPSKVRPLPPPPPRRSLPAAAAPQRAQPEAPGGDGGLAAKASAPAPPPAPPAPQAKAQGAGKPPSTSSEQ